MHDALNHYKQRWNLHDDGQAFASYSGYLQPVVFNGQKCMLKIARREKDKRGNGLMAWWNGEGAASILRNDDTALLMERATGARALAEMAKNGQDDESSGILCDVIARLHGHRPPYPTDLVPLTSWFKELQTAAATHGGLFVECNGIADELLAGQIDIVALHGDIHHGNVLDFGERGWLAIDPKGLTGERGFEYANIFCNPNATTATLPGRLSRQVNVIAGAAKLDRTRLLQWIAAWGGLSAAWCINDGENPQTAMQVAELAIASLQ